MYRYRRMEITCYILYVNGKAKKQKAIVMFHGQSCPSNEKSELVEWRHMFAKLQLNANGI